MSVGSYRILAPAPDRANEVVDLSLRPGLRRAEAELLVECSRPARRPRVEGRSCTRSRGSRGCRRSRPAGRASRTATTCRRGRRWRPGHAVELALACEEAADVPEQRPARRRSVVGKRDDVCCDARGRHCGPVRARERSARGRPPGRLSRAPVGETRPGSDRRRSPESPCASGTRGT